MSVEEPFCHRVNLFSELVEILPRTFLARQINEGWSAAGLDEMFT